LHGAGALFATGVEVFFTTGVEVFLAIEVETFFATGIEEGVQAERISIPTANAKRGNMLLPGKPAMQERLIIIFPFDIIRYDLEIVGAIPCGRPLSSISEPIFAGFKRRGI
jgi:hypothetical protein